MFGGSTQAVVMTRLNNIFRLPSNNTLQYLNGILALWTLFGILGHPFLGFDFIAQIFQSNFSKTLFHIDFGLGISFIILLHNYPFLRVQGARLDTVEPPLTIYAKHVGATWTPSRSTLSFFHDGLITPGSRAINYILGRETQRLLKQILMIPQPLRFAQ